MIYRTDKQDKEVNKMARLATKKEVKKDAEETTRLKVKDTEGTPTADQTDEKAIELSIEFSDFPEEKVVNDKHDEEEYQREYRRQGRMPVDGRKEPLESDSK